MLGRAEETGKKKILIIDDEPLQIELLIEYFSDASDNYEFIYSNDGGEGYQLAQYNLPHLVITDWCMPGMSGIELIRQLRLNVATHEIPIIVVTGVMTSPKEFAKAFSDEGVEFFRKPIDRTELLVRVKNLLSATEVISEAKRQKETLLKSVTELRTELETKQRELQTHLELLIHAGKVKERFMESLTRLQPYLNNEGKTRLVGIARQMQWVLNDEIRLGFERRFDESQNNLYEIIDRNFKCITRSEKRLCAFLKLNHSPSDIANITGKSLNSVNVALARLRPKLGCSSNKDIKACLHRLEGAPVLRPFELFTRSRSREYSGQA